MGIPLRREEGSVVTAATILKRGLVVAAALSLLSSPPLLDTVQDALIPGTESRDLSALTPGFRAKVEATLAGVRAQGWPVWVRATRRDAERQSFYKRLGSSSTLRSRHMSGTAVDVNLPAPWTLFPLHVAFYKELREAALANGLCSGADWHHPEKGRILARFGLGWDPAHLQLC